MNPLQALQALRVAGRALLRNPVRSLLTALGVIIGVAAVIAMMAIGQGARQRVEQAFASMGTNLLILLPGSSTSGGARGGAGSLPTLTADDLQAIRHECSAVTDLAPVWRTSANVVGDEINWRTSVYGTTAAYFAVRNWPADRGRLFSDAESDAQAKVALLGRTVADTLYGPGVDPSGRIVRVRNIPFAVIGTLASKGQSPMGQDYDDAIVIPANTYRTKIEGGLNQFVSGTVFVSATGKDDTARAEGQIRALLRDRHHLPADMPDDFSIHNLTEIASAQEEGVRIMTMLLSAIAIVSLIVGGIGIMNIMLVSVGERTREIGLRMAIGAQPHQILGQFLIEALILAGAGGMIGIVLGIGGAYALASALAGVIGAPVVQPEVVLIAVACSACTGIVFGLYPAVKASLLDPIDALRTE